MGVSLEKVEAEAPHLYDTVKRAYNVSKDNGLDPNVNKAAVVSVFDTSPSNEMGLNRNYSSGLMNRVGNLVIASALTFDDDGNMPLGYFCGQARTYGDVTMANCRDIISRTYMQYKGNYTSYLAALDWIIGQVDEFKEIDLGEPGTPLEVKFQAPYPVFAMFVTDGEPTDDHDEIEEKLRRMSQLPIFIQFVGVGVDGNFAFLRRLDKLTGRLIDNAGFFNAMEIMGEKPPAQPLRHSFLKHFGHGTASAPVLTDEQKMDLVLQALLHEFPDYYRNARRLGLIA